MALSAKERKQKQLAREQEELRVMPDSTYEFLQMPFHAYLEDDANWSNVTLSFDLMGIEAPSFEDDRGPAEFPVEGCFGTDEERDDAFEGLSGSIGRAEVMVDLLMEAAIEMAKVIQTYKRKAIAEQRRKIEVANLSDPEIRRQAMETIARLARIEDALDKNVRRTIPQWKVKGI
jgi:hypothetical protein